jgi:hypothetical protein
MGSGTTGPLVSCFTGTFTKLYRISPLGGVGEGEDVEIEDILTLT